jgi:hypothetical protein
MDKGALLKSQGRAKVKRAPHCAPLEDAKIRAVQTPSVAWGPYEVRALPTKLFAQHAP